MIGINSGWFILSLMPVNFKRFGDQPVAIKTGLFLKCPSPGFEILFLTIKGERHCIFLTHLSIALDGEVEAVLKPGERACPHLATTAGEPTVCGARPTSATPGWECRRNYANAGDASFAREILLWPCNHLRCCCSNRPAGIKQQ